MTGGGKSGLSSVQKGSLTKEGVEFNAEGMPDDGRGRNGLSSMQKGSG